MSGVEQDPKDPSTIPTGPGAVITQGPPKKLLDAITLIRAKLRDYPELNRLVAGQENSDRQIAFAVMYCVDDWNCTPPLIEDTTLASFPSMALLIDGSIVQVLQSVGLLQMRNHMRYSDGQGMQVSTSDKAPQLMGWANLFSQGYEAKKMRLKRALNLQGSLNGSGLPSEYTYINGWFSDGE